MKTFFSLWIALTTFASTAALAGTITPVATCELEHGGPDHGASLVIQEIAQRLPGRPARTERHLVASISTMTIAGARLWGAFQVKYVPADPRRPGSSGKYAGKSITIQKSTDGRPRRDRKTLVLVRAENADHLKFNESMLCKFSK